MLVSIAKSDKATDAARVSACIALLDRGWGKPDKTLIVVCLRASALTSQPKAPSAAAGRLDRLWRRAAAGQHRRRPRLVRSRG